MGKMWLMYQSECKERWIWAQCLEQMGPGEPHRCGLKTQLAIGRPGEEQENMPKFSLFKEVTFSVTKITYFFLFCLFRIVPMAYGGSQSEGSNRPMPQPQQCGIRTTSVTYTTAHDNAGSLTHWARPGIEPTSSWILGGFINCWATMGNSLSFNLICTFFWYALVFWLNQIVILFLHDLCLWGFVEEDFLTSRS